MSLYCEKCKEQTDLLADGMCIDCYKATGKDVAASAPTLTSTQPVQAVAASSTTEEDTTKLAFKMAEEINAEAEREAKQAESKKRLAAYFKAKILENEVVKKSVTGLAWGVAGLALAFGAYGIVEPYLSGDGTVQTEYYQAQVVDLPEVTQVEEVENTEEVTLPDWKRIDTDLDGIPDHKEKDKFGTDPLKVDTDGDGIGDAEEIVNGTDPLQPDDLELASASGSTVE